jgi:DNA-binding PadR family transcriptional regulator
MFGHHRERGERGRSRREHGGWFEEIRERKGAHRRDRLFEQGDLKLVVLDLLQARPRHGYELIKAIEELAGGDYSPSPGVIYPTLTLLEEIGYATTTQEVAGKKQYGITAEGAGHLESQRVALQRIRQRPRGAGARSSARRRPQSHGPQNPYLRSAMPTRRPVGARLGRADPRRPARPRRRHRSWNRLPRARESGALLVEAGVPAAFHAAYQPLIEQGAKQRMGAATSAPHVGESA